MVDSVIGDLVRLESDERLDIPDAAALQTLVYQSLVDALGGLLGECSGVLGLPVYDTSSAPLIGIGEATFVGSRRLAGSTHRAAGLVVHYNPASPVQSGSTSINLAGYVGNTNTYLWWARQMADSDTATRRRWVSGAEATFTPETRRRTRVIFGASTSATVAPDTTAEWFVFARCVSWLGSVPIIQSYSPWDIGSPGSGLGPPYPYIGQYINDVQGLLTSGVKSGVPALVSTLATRVLQLLDSAWDVSPNGVIVTPGTLSFGASVPANSGATQMNARVAALENTTRCRVLYAAQVQANGTVVKERGDLIDPGQYNGNVVVTPTGTGTYSLVCDIASAFLTAVVSPSLNDNTGATAADRIGFIHAESPVSTTISVSTYDSAGAAADRGFSIVVLGLGP